MPPFRRFIQILDAFIAYSPAENTDAANPPRDLVSLALFENHPSTSDSSAEIPLVRVGGEFITPAGQRRLQVIKFVGQGTRAKVYRVSEVGSHQIFALKVIHERLPINLMAIAMEIAKTDALASHQIPFSRIIETGVTYVLKEWIDGIGGDYWLREWLENRADPADPAFVALVRFFRDASAKGLQMDDLRPSNLMLRNGTEWVPIDVGKITAAVPPAVAMKCYREIFIRRWLWVSRSPFWYLVYWTWCRVRRANRRF